MKNLLYLLLVFGAFQLQGQFALDLRPYDLDKEDEIELNSLQDQNISTYFDSFDQRSKEDYLEFNCSILANSLTLKKNSMGSNIELKYGLDISHINISAYHGQDGDNEIQIFNSEIFTIIRITDKQSTIELLREKRKEAKNDLIYLGKKILPKNEEHSCSQIEDPNKRDFSSSPIKLNNRAGCNRDEYIVDVGIACDFLFLEVHTFSLTQTFSSMLGSYLIAAEHYKRCNMRVYFQLTGISIETSPSLFYDYPICNTIFFPPSSGDAFAYNQEFANSSGLPTGDVATLWTGLDLRGALCVSDIGGMAYFTDGVCNFNKTNVIGSPSGASRGDLQAHEIGHNLGVGIDHGNNPPNYFYEDYDDVWHTNTINAIHSNLDTKSCVDHIEYCCFEQEDIYVCEPNLNFCINLPSCGGTFAHANGQQIGAQLCGGPGAYSINQTMLTGCLINSTTFRVIDCTDKGNNHAFPPLEFRRICIYDKDPTCLEFECVKSWKIINDGGLDITTIRNRICISAPQDMPEQTVTVRLRPTLFCGGTGDIVTWQIMVKDCGDGPKERSEFALGETADTKTHVFPNPATNFINIESTKDIDVIDLYDLNGKLLMTVPSTEVLELPQSNQSILLLRITYSDQTMEYHKVSVM